MTKLNSVKNPIWTKLKMWQNSKWEKIQIVSKLKLRQNSNCNKTQDTHVWLPSILQLKWEPSKTFCVWHLWHSVPIPFSGVWGRLVKSRKSPKSGYIFRSAEVGSNPYTKTYIVINKNSGIWKLKKKLKFLHNLNLHKVPIWQKNVFTKLNFFQISNLKKKIKLWRKKTPIVNKRQLWHNLIRNKTLIVTKLKVWHNSDCDITQIETKNNCVIINWDKYFDNKNSTIWWDELRAALVRSCAVSAYSYSYCALRQVYCWFYFSQ